MLEFSEHFDAPRTRGDLGWLPEGVAARQIDSLLFGTDTDGNRLLPFRSPSIPQLDEQAGMWSVLIVEEFQEAREVEPEALEVLKDTAMTIFLNQERRNIDLYLDLDSDITNWVNKQVSLNSLAPTPGAAQQDPLQGFLPPGASISGGPPTPVPPSNGIPGISAPVQ